MKTYRQFKTNMLSGIRISVWASVLSMFLVSGALLLTGGAYGQNIDQNWIFGFGGGYDWNSNSVIPNSSLTTYEGCASISDASGNLLMYTDGTDVWDGNHNLVTTNFDMTGDSSSTQSGVIIPKPGTEDYYIITVDYVGPDPNLPYNSRMAWYEADMVGGVLSSVFPVAGNTMIVNSSEKIAAVRKPCDPSTIWIIGHNFTAGQYEVFAATNSGIAPTGVTLNDQFSSTLAERKVGSLRFNHDGTLLASAVFGARVELMGFDPNTGTFTGTQLKFELSQGGIPENKPYGLEFSPDNNTLYTSVTGGASIQHNSIWQFDVSNLNETAIETSRQLVVDYGDGIDNLQPGQMQLAPDGNIYVAMWYYEFTPGTGPGVGYLGRISNPNVGGAGNFNGMAIQGPAGSPNWSVRGLPTFLTETFTGSAQTVTVCSGSTVQLQAPAGGTNYSWTPATDLNCTSCPDPVASPTADVTYTLQYIDGNGDCQIITHPVDVIDCNTGCDAINLTANFSYGTTSSQLEVRDLSTVLAPDQITYIEWNFDDGDGWEAATPGTASTHFYQLEGTYEVCLHAAVFITPDICCHDTFCQTITVLFDTCSYYEALFSAEQVAGSMNVTFEDTTDPHSDISIWDFGDGTTQTTSGTSYGPFDHTYSAAGDYDVTLVTIDHINDSLCCIDTLTRRVTVLAPSALKVGPTLVDDRMEVQILVDQPEECQLRIFSPSGTVWFKQADLSNGKRSLDLSGLNPGVYFIELSGMGATHLKKFVKF